MPAEEVNTPEHRLLAQVIATDVLVKRAVDLAARDADRRAKAAELIPRVVEAMVRGDRIDPGQEAKLASLLEDPIEALELLRKTALHRAAAEEARLGSAGDPRPAVKRANAFTGQRTSEVRDSDRALFGALGVPISG